MKIFCMWFFGSLIIGILAPVTIVVICILLTYAIVRAIIDSVSPIAYKREKYGIEKVRIENRSSGYDSNRPDDSDRTRTHARILELDKKYIH